MAAGHVEVWSRIGASVQQAPAASLKALLGHEPSMAALTGAGLVVPTFELFRSDPCLDPNILKLELSAQYLEMRFFVRVLALWGPAVLREAAWACAQLQMQRQSTCDAARATARDAAYEAVRLHRLDEADPAARRRLQDAVDACTALYRPFEDSPDSADAMQAWNELGAPWFAAETALKDCSLSPWDGPPPREASKTWGTRMASWPESAADAAASWCSLPEVMRAMKAHLLGWEPPPGAGATRVTGWRSVARRLAQFGK